MHSTYSMDESNLHVWNNKPEIQDKLVGQCVLSGQELAASDFEGATKTCLFRTSCSSAGRHQLKLGSKAI